MDATDRSAAALSDGQATALLRMGSGPIPALLLHGLTGAAEVWVPLSRRLGAALTMYAFDQRGHGAAREHPGPYGLSDSARGAVLIDPVVVPLAAEHAADLVRMVRAAQPPHPFDDLRRRMRAEQPTWSDEDVDLRALGARAAGPDAVEAICTEIAEPGRLDLERTIARIPCPVLLCHADAASGSIVPERVIAAATGMTHVTVRSFPGAGHSIQRTQPEALAAEILRFVDRLPE